MSITMISLNNDALEAIISFLSDDDCVVFARVCWYLHDLVHDIRTTITATGNIFEAVRIGSLLSFKKAYDNCRDGDKSCIEHAIRMNTITAEMLLYAYNRNHDDYVAYRLCKMNVFVPTTFVQMNEMRSLVIHAITHNKIELLTYIESQCESFDSYCACGYAKIGDYDRFIEHYDPLACDEYLSYYAHIGDNKHIIDIVGYDCNDHEEAKTICGRVTMYEVDTIVSIRGIKRIIKHDNVNAFNCALHPMTDYAIFELCIKYNAVNIVRESIQCEMTYALQLSSKHNVADMTLTMAKMLLSKYRNNELISKVVINAYNYRLTEMLRERGLYDQMLMTRSSHNEFTAIYNEDSILCLR